MYITPIILASFKSNLNLLTIAYINVIDRIIKEVTNIKITIILSFMSVNKSNTIGLPVFKFTINDDNPNPTNNENN